MILPSYIRPQNYYLPTIICNCHGTWKEIRYFEQLNASESMEALCICRKANIHWFLVDNIKEGFIIKGGNVFSRVCHSVRAHNDRTGQWLISLYQMGQLFLYSPFDRTDPSIVVCPHPLLAPLKERSHRQSRVAGISPTGRPSCTV